MNAVLGIMEQENEVEDKHSASECLVVAQPWSQRKRDPLFLVYNNKRP